MPVPDFNIPTAVTHNTPPNKRLPKYLAAFKGFVSALTWRMNIFLAYMNGDAQSNYNASTTYYIGDKVMFNFSTYESLTDGNTGNTPSQDANNWTLRCPSHIGAKERSRYNGRYMTLTYALNKQFGTIFRQPPYPAPYDYGLGGGAWSDIYITNATPAFTTFVAGVDSSESSKVGISPLSDYIPVAPTYSTASAYQFVIHIPSAVFASLGPDLATRKSVVDSFVAKIMPAGIYWTITTY